MVEYGLIINDLRVEIALFRCVCGEGRRAVFPGDSRAYFRD